MSLNTTNTKLLECINDGGSSKSIRLRGCLHFLDLPPEILHELNRYLPAYDIESISQTCSQLLSWYSGCRWKHCVIFSDKYGHEWCQHARKIYMKYDAIPLFVFFEPANCRWFDNRQVKSLVLSTQFGKKDMFKMDRALFEKPLPIKDYPNLQSFKMSPALDFHKLQELWESPFMLTLRSAVATQGEGREKPVWNLGLKNRLRFDPSHLLKVDNLCDMLCELTLSDSTEMSPEAVETLELPNLETLSVQNMANETYSAILRQVHHWPKLKHLKFYLNYFKHSQLFVSPAVHEIVRLPVTLEVCEMILRAPQVPDRVTHEPVNSRIRVEAVTLFRDGDEVQNNGYEILKYLDLPRVQTVTQSFYTPPKITKPYLGPSFGQTLKHLTLDIVCSPPRFVFQMDGLIHLRSLVLSLPFFEPSLSNSLESTMEGICRKLAGGQEWKERDLRQMFKHLLKKHQDEIFDLGDELEPEQALEVCLRLISDPLGLGSRHESYGRQLNFMVLFEALVASVRSALPRLEYLCLNKGEPYSSPELQRLLVAPPESVKQVVLSYRGHGQMVLPAVKYRAKIKRGAYNDVLFDLALKRRFPLIEQGEIILMACNSDGFTGWV